METPQFVDANIFIRHLTGDDPKKAMACLNLFARAGRDEVSLITSETIIAEVVYVLSSKKLYGLARSDIRARLAPILSLKGFKRPHRPTLLRALDLYVEHPIDFEDALAIAQMEREGIREILSYDAHFDHVASVRRREP